MSSDYDLTLIPSCSKEAFAPSDNSDNAYELVDGSLVNWLQWGSSGSLATDTIEGAISVVFDTTAPLCNDDLSSEAICQTPHPGPGSCTFQCEVLPDDTKDPRETATPVGQTSSKPLPNIVRTLPTEISRASNNCEFSTQRRSNSKYSKSSRKNSDRSSRKSIPPTATTLVVLESASGFTRDSPSIRKINHCHIEKQYRTRLNASFQDLLRALPQKVVGQSQIDSLNRPRKGNTGKRQVLELARRHIELLERRLTWLEEDRRALISDLEDLKGL